MNEQADECSRDERRLRYSALDAIAKRLNLKMTQAQDWRHLADELGFDVDSIGNFELRTNPTLAMLCEWVALHRDSRINLHETLRSKISHLGRSDVLQIFDEATSWEVNRSPQSPSKNNLESGQALPWQPLPQISWAWILLLSLVKRVSLFYKSPADDSLVSYLSTYITNIQTAFMVFLLFNDLLLYFGRDFVPFCLLSHICLLVPLSEFWFCEMKVHAQYGLTIKAAESRQQQFLLDKSADNNLQNQLVEIDKKRKLIAKELRRAVMLTVTIETILVAYFIYQHCFMKAIEVFAASLVLLMADYAFNLFLFFKYYPSVNTAFRRVEKRFAQLLPKKPPTNKI